MNPSEPDLALFTVLGDASREQKSTLSETDLLRAYREIRRLRLLDERMILIQRQGRVGFYGAAQGQEAVPIAAGLSLAPDDWVFPALREQSIMLVRGFPLEAFVAQVFGNEKDGLKGRQMPSHQSGRRVQQVSWSSCIGPQIPQAVGAAWAMKLRHAKSIAMGFMGDGATSEPDFHVAMRFAARYAVPVVLVCQNNGWSISVPTSRQTASPTIAVKGRAYGIPGVRVDGNDVLAVHEVLKGAVDRARSGGGPTFVEAVTYRMGAHSTSDDPSRYRSQEEVDAWAKKDPLERLRSFLLRRGFLKDADDRALTELLTAEVKQAVDKVEAAPPPRRESLFEDVYETLPWNLREQADSLARLPHAPTHG